MKACGVVIASSLFLVGFPFLGLVLTGRALAPYLTFPPLTRYVEHAPFSWTAFLLVTAVIASAIVPCGWRAFRTRILTMPKATRYRFPWWGWGGMALAMTTWFLAWTRFSWFASWQAFTFTPLWLAYVLVVNGLTYWRTGHCSLVDRPRFVLLLFPVSALFWWYFEYLNRFVQNWSYVGIDAFGPWQYVCFATLPFSTVLPAMLGTSELLRSAPRVYAGLESSLALRIAHPHLLSWVALSLSAFGLGSISIWPDYCFPFLWVAPVLILTACMALFGMRTIFSPLQHGDWSQLWLWALAAVVCGGFWEMWNLYSLPKWVYSVPFVDRFHLFEMPLLGYGGYIPFGLECAAVVDFAAQCQSTDSANSHSVG